MPVSISVGSGTFVEPCGLVSTVLELTIFGAGRNATFLTCTSNDDQIEGTLLTVFSSVTLLDLGIENTTSTAVVVMGMADLAVSHVLLHRVTFSGCGGNSDDSGGAVAVDVFNQSEALNVTVMNSSFFRNSPSSTGYGGAVDILVDSCSAPTFVNMTDAVFTNNSAFSGEILWISRHCLACDFVGFLCRWCV